MIHTRNALYHGCRHPNVIPLTLQVSLNQVSHVCKFTQPGLRQWRSFSVASFTSGNEVLRDEAGMPTSLGEEISVAWPETSVQFHPAALFFCLQHLRLSFTTYMQACHHDLFCICSLSCHKDWRHYTRFTPCYDEEFCCSPTQITLLSRDQVSCAIVWVLRVLTFVSVWTGIRCRIFCQPVCYTYQKIYRAK